MIELEKTGPVSDEEANEILSRFNASHWNNPTEKARYSIPANPKRDDDIRLAAYIEQSADLRRQLAEARRVARVLARVGSDKMARGDDNKDWQEACEACREAIESAVKP